MNIGKASKLSELTVKAVRYYDNIGLVKPHQNISSGYREYNEEDVGEFIAYWLGRPNALFSEFQWTQKFAYTMKRKRVASGYEPTRKIGSQQVKVAPGIEADDNARKLVEKYATSTKKS